MNKRRGIITGICLIIFIYLIIIISESVTAGTSDAITFDTAISEWFYSIRTPWLTEIVKVITFMGNTETIVTICVLLLLVPLVIGAVQQIMDKGKSTDESIAIGSTSPVHNIGFYIAKKIGVPIAVVAIVGSAINKVIKHTIMRPRPDVSLHLIEQGGWSFPSGHSISGLLLYGFLVWLIRRYCKNKTFVNVATAILTLLWIGIGLSRVYLGVHYPTDVMGGWTLGMIMIIITVTIVESVEKRKETSNEEIN